MMRWVTNIVFLVLLTTLTGSILALIWRLHYRLVKRFAGIRYIYFSLCFTMAGYLLPLFYLGCRLKEKHMEFSNVDSLLTVKGRYMNGIIMMIFLVWFSGFIFQVLRYISISWNVRWTTHPSMKARHNLREMVERTRTWLGIRREITVRQGVRIVSPFVEGIRTIRVYFPMGDFEEDVLEQIVYHELTHVRHKDYIWRPFCYSICCIYWFNPIAWSTFKMWRRWSEIYCDYACCQQVKPKRYFQMLYDFNEFVTNPGNVKLSMWLDDEHELEWRVNYMKMFYGRKGLRKSIAAVVMCLFLLTGTVCTYATTGVLAKGYNTLWYNSTVEGQEKQALSEEQEYVEHEGTVEDLKDYTVVEGDSNPLTRAVGTTIDVSLANYSYYRSAEFYKKKTGSIYVSVSVEPTDRVISVGIIRPDGTTTYVEGKKHISHEFTNLKMDGKFQVFIANQSGVRVNIGGYYK